MQAGDRLVILGKPDSLRELAAAAEDSLAVSAR
jgi:hypothetical protein